MKKVFHSFSARLTFYILTLVFVIFGCIAVVFLSYAKEKEQEQAMLYTSALQRNFIQKIDSELSDVETAIKVAAGEVDDMYGMPDSIVSIARNVVKNNKLLKGVGIAFRPGFYPSRERLFIDYIYKRTEEDFVYKRYGKGIGNYTNRNWYKRAMNGERSFWTKPYIDNDNKKERMVSFVQACTDHNGRVYGVIFADVTIDDLTESLDSLRIYPHSYSFILNNKTGKYISGTDKRVDFAADYRITSRLIDCPELKEIGDKMTTGDSGAMRTSLGGNDVMLCYSTLKRTDWSVCSVNRYSDVMADLGSATFYIFAILVVGLVLLSVCIRQLVNYISLPIRNLTEAAHLIGSGNFSVELPAVDTKDDIERLHNAFANMQQSLKEHIEELKNTTTAKQRIESELAVAHNIQMSLVPKVFSPFPECGQLDLYACLKPAKEVGGDFYDFFLSNGKLYFAIGDVSGKGVPASLFMAITKTMFRIIAASEPSPANIMDKLNCGIACDNDTNMFVTMFIGVLDTVSGNMSFCNAGHNPPMLIGNGKDVEAIETRRNLPLGIVGGFQFAEQKTEIGNDCALLLYTDGITEAEDEGKRMFGEERLKDVLHGCGNLPAKEIIGKVNSAVSAFAGCAGQSDDLTLLCFRINGGKGNGSGSKNVDGTEPPHTITMGNTIEESAKLHPFVNDIAKEAALDDSTANAINLAVEEAAVNAIMYAYPKGKEGEITLKAEVDKVNRRLTFTLSDHGVDFNPLSRPDADTTASAKERKIGGLGILLVKRLMDSVDYRRNGGMNILTMTKNI